jgi:hypothetical protein
MLQSALEYLQLGYPIFPVCSPAMGQHKHKGAPCKNPGKTPLVKWQPFHGRVPTINEARDWWSRWPMANIGMATGALSGVVVLDADSGTAKKLAMDQGGVDRTPAVFTGKPGGIHYWLAHPGESVSNFVAGKNKHPGLDFRGDGGFVLVPPSRHASGAYYRWVDGTAELSPQPVPPWLMTLLRDDGTTSVSDDGGREHAGGIDMEIIVYGVPEGARDTAMWKLACKLRNDDVERKYAELIVRQAALACDPPFDEALALEKVARAYQTYDPEPVFKVTEAATLPENAPAGGSYPLQQIAELLDMEQDNAPCLVDGILWADRATWAFSDPNTGKTLFFLAMLLHIAAGRPFCGRPVKQGPVLVIEEDSPLSVVAEYVEMLADIYEFDLESLPFWINRVQGLRIVDATGIQIAIDTINACPEKPVAVLFDACERLVPSDRFTTKEMDPLTRLFQWCISEKITPAMIDHTNKDRPKKGEKPITPMDKLYGARAKSAVSDVMIHFAGSLKEGGTQVTFVKFRGEAPPSFSVTFNAIDGFAVRSEKIVSQSPAEQEVMRFFNNQPRLKYSVAVIADATNLKRRTAQRVVQVLTKRGWLVAHGDGFDRAYEANPSTAGVFE